MALQDFVLKIFTGGEEKCQIEMFIQFILKRAGQTDAQSVGREKAMQNNSEHIIHGLNGRIQNKNSYGNDPCPPRDKK